MRGHRAGAVYPAHLPSEAPLHRVGRPGGFVRTLAFALALGCATPDTASPADFLIFAQAWDRAQYASVDDDERTAALQKLAARLASDVSVEDDARPRVWQGAVLAAQADSMDGLAALTVAARAKRLLEQANAQPLDQATRGILEATLGALYAQAPGFPISFGDRRQAEAHFHAGLRADPGNPESYYYFAQFLMDQRRYPEADLALRSAHRLLHRPDRPIGDSGLSRLIDEGRARLHAGN